MIRTTLYAAILTLFALEASAATIDVGIIINPMQAIGPVPSGTSMPRP